MPSKELFFKGKKTFRNLQTRQRLIVELEIWKQWPNGHQRDARTLNPLTAPFFEIHITGEEYNPHASHPFSGGQVEMHINNTSEFSSPKTLAKLLKLWRRWHLNSMQAGTPTMRANLRAGGVTNLWKDFDKTRRIAGTKRIPGRYKAGEKTSYTYGDAWLVDKVPSSVITALVRVFRS